MLKKINLKITLYLQFLLLPQGGGILPQLHDKTGRSWTWASQKHEQKTFSIIVFQHYHQKDIIKCNLSQLLIYFNDWTSFVSSLQRLKETFKS